ncbi:copper amine oxidase N-terminal domain-containing protein [Sedimentibacter hydroxybenzoicus DSM 7310]|uniref:Copper amine oxidase N-terminal domain-containing protein n=1 Tax=Sedimentibacter hydroxybenzoicus DSM 7310 TaxID=1123245 RepID=A0A974GXJ1_SEDHY|nr:copper amine oxidase N-terminal domain-containing protein [Sedimentibacter hydroxybenzoicus]NYB75652.1 copper amine oxidase N-terminal domain-containing protein [Sedimentibacter hydroxybenzoicus DSM 7310]
MNRNKLKNVIIFSLILMFAFSGVHVVYGESIDYTELVMSLPKDYSLTDFNSDYSVKINGKDYVIKGSPFLYRNLTYIPIRDVSEIFNIYVTFNEADRTVLLASEEKEIIISPNMSIYGDMGTSGALIKTVDHTAIEPEASFMLINDRSYVPIRFITETFGFSVDYNDVNKQIAIKGESQTPRTNSFYTEEQQMVIDAVAAYESNMSIQFKGITDFLGEDREIQANVKKELTKDVITEIITVKETNGKQYKAVHKAMFNGNNSTGVFEMFPTRGDGSFWVK